MKITQKEYTKNIDFNKVWNTLRLFNWSYVRDYSKNIIGIASDKSLIHGVDKKEYYKLQEDMQDILGYHILSFYSGHSQYAPEQKKYAIGLKTRAQALREYRLLNHLSKCIKRGQNNE